MTVSPPPASARARAETLRGLCGGAVHLPGDPGYDLARAPWNAQVESFPAAVAYPAFPEEVADVLRAASAAGLEVAPQGTGHGAAPLGGRLGDAVLLRTAAIGDAVDRHGPAGRTGRRRRALGRPRGRRRHPRAGRAAPLVPGRRRRRVLHRRWHRLVRPPARPAVQRDHRRRGRPRRRHLRPCHRRRGRRALLGAARRRQPRSASSRRLEFRLFEIDSAVAGFLAWDWTQVERVLPAWAAWCAEAPDDVTTSFRVLHAPPIPSVPAELRGRGLVILDGAVLGSDERAARSSRRCAPSPRSSTPSPGCRRRHWCACTWSRRGPAPPTPAVRC